MDSVTHLVGPKITIGGRDIQRCSICGEKLLDTLNQASPDGMVQSSCWPIGRLLRIEGSCPTQMIVLPDPEDGKLPEDSCIELVE